MKKQDKLKKLTVALIGYWNLDNEEFVKLKINRVYKTKDGFVIDYSIYYKDFTLILGNTIIKESNSLMLKDTDLFCIYPTKSKYDILCAEKGKREKNIRWNSWWKEFNRTGRYDENTLLEYLITIEE